MADNKKNVASTSKGGENSDPQSDLKTRPSGEAAYQIRIPPVQVATVRNVGTPQVLELPPPVLGNATIVNGINANIEWDREMEPSARPCRFKVSWWTDETDKRCDLTNSRNYLLTKLKAGSTYSANVTRVKSNGDEISTSNTVHFHTAPASPKDLRVENLDSSPHNSIIVYFKDVNENREVEHEVLVEALTGVAEPRRETTANRSVLIDGLTPGGLYRVSVKTIDRDGDLRSQAAYYEPDVMTYPAVPQGVELEHRDEKLIFSWEQPDPKPPSYDVQWQANGVKTVSKVDEEVFVLEKPELSTMYRLRVAAVNRAGRSYFSDEKYHQTEPAPPRNVIVRKNELMPTSSFIVRYEDPDLLRKSYEIFATDLNGRVVSEARSATHTAVLNGLNPGIPHYIYVIAVHGELKSEKAYCTQNNA